MKWRNKYFVNYLPHNTRHGGYIAEKSQLTMVNSFLKMLLINIIIDWLRLVCKVKPPSSSPPRPQLTVNNLNCTRLQYTSKAYNYMHRGKDNLMSSSFGILNSLFSTSCWIQRPRKEHDFSLICIRVCVDSKVYAKYLNQCCGAGAAWRRHF